MTRVLVIVSLLLTACGDNSACKDVSSKVCGKALSCPGGSSTDFKKSAGILHYPNVNECYSTLLAKCDGLGAGFNSTQCIADADQSTCEQHTLVLVTSCQALIN